MTDNTITARLATGRLDIETPTGWRQVDAGLRDEIVRAVLAGDHAIAVHRALRAGKPIAFRDDEKDITVRWSPA